MENSLFSILILKEIQAGTAFVRDDDPITVYINHHPVNPEESLPILEILIEDALIEKSCSNWSPGIKEYTITKKGEGLLAEYY